MSTSNPELATQSNRAPDGFPADVLLDLRGAGGRGLRQRLERALRVAIQERRLVAGTALPASRVLAGELGVSRSVVVEAYRNLAADGYLESSVGAWTRVRGDPHGLVPPPAGDDRGRDDDDDYFARPRRRSLLQAPASIRLLGGLPDASLFPRARWLRHYRAALAEVPDRELTYPQAGGAAALRVALAAYLGRVRGVATTPERVVVCTGITQGLTLVARALVRAGRRRVAMEDPCFALHREAVALTGLEPVAVPSDADGLDPARLSEAGVDAVVVAPAHSYPRGATLDARRRRAVVDWARRHDAVIVEDDYDAEFRYDRLPIGALQGLAPERVIYLGSASKTVTPALRLGWIVAPPWLSPAVRHEKHADDMGSSLLEQLAFARFVATGDLARFLRRVRPVYRSRRDAMVTALSELLPAARLHGASAGLHLHVLLPAEVDERAVALGAFRRGVLVEDAACHWADPSSAPPSLVLGYGGCAEPAIRRGVEILAGVVG